MNSSLPAAVYFNKSLMELLLLEVDSIDGVSFYDNFAMANLIFKNQEVKLFFVDKSSGVIES